MVVGSFLLRGTEMMFFSFTEKWIKGFKKARYRNGENIIHLLARHDDSKLLILKNVLEAMEEKLRSDMLTMKNYLSQTPLEVAKTFEIQNLLTWSAKQKGFYYLLSAPVVLMMYSTIRQANAEQEYRELEKVFPKFNVKVITYKNLG